MKTPKSRRRIDRSAYGAPRRVLVQAPFATIPLIEVLPSDRSNSIAAPNSIGATSQFDCQSSFPTPIEHADDRRGNPRAEERRPRCSVEIWRANRQIKRRVIVRFRRQRHLQASRKSGRDRRRSDRIQCGTTSRRGAIDQGMSALA